MQLTITNHSSSNPLTLDLTNYIAVGDESMDPSDPAFSSKIISHSLLREGGVLAATDYKDKELAFPLIMGPFANGSAMANEIIEVNQILESAGATASWRDDGMSQPTVFDLIGGQLDIEYSYRRGQQNYTNAKLRLFANPFGHTAGPRAYAAASAVGPLLMISPYASSGALAIGASGAGWGGQQQGASSGVFYTAAPSLAGDAPALIQMTYTAPLPAVATNAGVLPTVAVSALPDANYQPLITSRMFYPAGASNYAADAVASQYVRNDNTTFSQMLVPLPGSPVPVSWSGDHRLFAIARASSVPLALTRGGNAAAPNPATATVYPGDWQLLDLGTYTLRASEAPPVASLPVTWSSFSASSSIIGDVTAFVTLPDSATWYFQPAAITPSGYGGPITIITNIGLNLARTAYSNVIDLDDVVGDQFIVQSGAPNGRITQYSRGLVPRPDPKAGLPILAVLGMGQISVASSLYGAGASWANPQNKLTSAQVNVVERTRYVLP